MNVPTLKLAGGAPSISGVTIVTIVTCIVIMADSTTFINKTKVGQAMLAVSGGYRRGNPDGHQRQRHHRAHLCDRLRPGVPWRSQCCCSAYPSLTPTQVPCRHQGASWQPCSADIGSIPGALIGGILLGSRSRIFPKHYISSQLSDAIVFAVLIIVLLVRPTGILGKKITEKV
ncbi:MAG: hypothetical protein ACLUD2_16850 [Clostridium sp.]